MEISIHAFLDFHYGADGDQVLRNKLQQGVEIDDYDERGIETALHVAVRRYRTAAVGILLDYDANINAKSGHGKTAYAHALRRGFDDLAKLLLARGADSALNTADQFAVAVVHGKLEEAAAILETHPEAVRTGNPEEDRLLADVAGRNPTRPVDCLIQWGADLAAPGLDDGSPLHQAAWFGQPQNAELLIKAGAPLNVFDRTHASSPLGWAVHGSRYSGGAQERQPLYVKLVEMLLRAGSDLHYPDDPSDRTYQQRLLEDASPAVAKVLKSFS